MSIHFENGVKKAQAEIQNNGNGKYIESYKGYSLFYYEKFGFYEAQKSGNPHVVTGRSLQEVKKKMDSLEMQGNL